MGKEYMHKWLEEDAVKYDLPSEEIIQQLATDNDEFQAENKTLRDALQKIAEQANRATMVQDRSVTIIKQTCGVIFSEAELVLKGKTT